ncbi:flagellar formation protein [Clostridium gasigenes]|uniref:Flagellar formation protein n=2 Tax=Clostridium gasigenes TaxID=94869 RepID=A0A7X0SBI9_9CLOT|nr:flagellar formation protein [Clostridium gasigenes]MBB6714628.1 flagellar formation protein [Clostridium gasigenes]MBU3089305.1 flagellar formation protein [Clostridium gasigenes]
MIIKLIISLVIILGLILILFKLSNKKINDINDNKYINVIDKVQISKDSYILIVKIGKKGYIMSSSGGKTEKLEDLSEEEMVNIQKEKLKRFEETNIKYENTINLIKERALKLKKKICSGGKGNEK